MSKPPNLSLHLYLLKQSRKRSLIFNTLLKSVATSNKSISFSSISLRDTDKYDIRNLRYYNESHKSRPTFFVLGRISQNYRIADFVERFSLIILVENMLDYTEK